MRPAALAALLAASLGCAAPSPPADASAPPPDRAPDVTDVADAPADLPPARCAVPPGADPRVRAALPRGPWRCVRYPVPLAAPREVIETRDGALLVTEQSSGRVVRFDATSVTPVATGLHDPIGLREAPDGALYVTEEGAQALTRVDRATGAATRVAAGLANVTYLELGPGPVAYVASFPSFTDPGIVHRVDLAAAPPAASPFARGFFVTEGLALAPDGALVVAEWGGVGSAGPGRLTRMPPGGGERTAGRELVSGLRDVYGIHRAANGYLVSAGDRVVNVRDDGAVEEVLTDVAVPSGVTVTRGGDILVLEHVDVGHRAAGYLLRLARAP